MAQIQVVRYPKLLQQVTTNSYVVFFSQKTEDQSRRSASQEADKTESIDQNWEDIDDDFDDF